jgi:RecA-family ATPase
MTVAAHTAVRLKLRENGYAPIPVNGKRPPFEEWQKKTTANPVEIELWEKAYSYASSTGILTAHTPTLDIDIMNPEAAAAVEELVRERFEERGYVLVRIGKAPKRAIPFRTDTPFKKIIRNVVAPNAATEQKIELLANGQQVIADGIHPETEKPYSWHGGDPCSIKHEDLPYIIEVEAKQLLDDAVELLVEKFGYSLLKARPEKDAAEGNGGRGAEDWGYLLDNIRFGRELHDTLRDFAGKLTASGMSEGAAINFLREAMERSEALQDERWRERYDDIPRLVSSALNKQQETPPPPLPFINLDRWCNESPPKREWSVLDRFPLRQVALLSGEGAVGKSILMLQLCAAHVLGRDWLNTMPEIGPAIYVGAEDEADELWRRMAGIVAHYNASMSDLKRDGFHILSLAGEDAILGRVDRNGIVRPTQLFAQLKERACDIKPKLIGLDTASDIFAGNENDRAQVRQFIGLLRGMAIASNSTVSVCSHPSLIGITSGSGMSGTTAWHNSVRARAYMHSVKVDDGAEIDRDLRQIDFMKNQYGPMAESVRVRWKEGVFVVEPSVDSLEKLAKNRKVDDLFLTLLDQFKQSNRRVSDKPTSHNYAPTAFSEEPGVGTGKKTFADAMKRLFQSNKIQNEPYGKPSQNYSRIVKTGSSK